MIQSMKTLREVQAIVGDCEYADWDLQVKLSPEGRMYLQCRMVLSCSITSVEQEWGGRKWLLSPHMMKSEIIQTALKAILTAVEHEAREAFLYRGRAIFGPHFDVDQLWEISILKDER